MDTKRKGTTKSGGQKHTLDKFYTKPSIAAWCLAKLDLDSYDLIIEPSAGSGAFSNLIPNVVAYDLHPEHEGIIQQDWLTYQQERTPAVRTLVVGNPPFGQQNRLAVQFINHAAGFADTIAFIIPASFQKESLQARLHPNLHLAGNHPLPKNSFLLNEVETDVPCVFQIWEHDGSRERQLRVLPELVGFRFVRKDQNPDLFIQRIGGNAGKVGEDWEQRSDQSNYFIKVAPQVTVEQVKEELAQLKFPTRDLSVGPRSVSQREILHELGQNSSTLVTLPV